MRQIIIITCLICGFLSSYSQNFDYSLSVTQSAYASLTQSDSIISDSSFWESNTLKIPIGFNFSFGDLSFEEVNVRNSGVLSFDPNNSYSIVAFWKNFNIIFDTTNTSISKVRRSVQINPSNGGMIFKLEFNEVSYLSLTGKNITVSFQIWLNQIDSSVEFHFGPNNLSNSQENVIIGFLDLNINDGVGIGSVLTGNVLSPNVINVTGVNNNSLLSNIPPSGTVYKFSKN